MTRKILVEMPMTEVPQKHGHYFVTSTNLVTGTNYFMCIFDGEWNLPGIDSWFKEVEVPSEDEISKAAKKSCKGNSHVMRYVPMLNQFKSGANYIISKLTEKL